MVNKFRNGGLTPDLLSLKTKIMASGPITSWEIDGETVSDFISGGSKSLQMVIAAMKSKKQRHYFAKKGLSSQGHGFSIGHVWM